MGMGMTGAGTVGDGDKYLSQCSSLIRRYIRRIVFLGLIVDVHCYGIATREQ